jgi:hypothetical protein
LGSGATKELALDRYGDLRVSQGLPNGSAVTAAGMRFRSTVAATITSAIAPVAATPTTAAQWVLWNADPTKSYLIETVGAFLHSGTAAAGQVVEVTRFTSPTQVAAASIVGIGVINCNGSISTSRARIISAVTLDAASTLAWTPIAVNGSANTAVGSVMCVNEAVDGKIIVPPNSGLALAVISGTGTTPLFAPVFQWVEAELTLA